MTITHIVAFKWKSTASEEAKKGLMDKMRALEHETKFEGKSYISNFKSGIESSPEPHSKGHNFITTMEFQNSTERDYYLSKDPAHVNFVKSIGESGIVEDVTVFDFEH